MITPSFFAIVLKFISFCSQYFIPELTTYTATIFPFRVAVTAMEPSWEKEVELKQAPPPK